MRVEILGTGCSKCTQLFNTTKDAVAKTGKFIEIVKVEDPIKIMEYGVMNTPAFVVDKEVKSSGKLLSVDEIVEFIS